MEERIYTWEKRFMQKHYSYRDSQDAATVLFVPIPVPPFTPEAQALALAATQALTNAPGTVYYPFGFNARTNALTGSVFRWPNIGDYATGVIAPRAQCYAREVLVYVTEDTWVRFVSLNPVYLNLIAWGYSIALIATLGVPQFITEVEHFVAAGDKDTFYPTYGTAIIFRADTVAGDIYITIEGNVEGGE